MFEEREILSLLFINYKPTSMSQALVKNYMHLIFGTKHRIPLIHAPYANELHAYLGALCNNLDCHTVIVGGYTDHVHVFCMVSQKIALMKRVQELKSNSSRWMKRKDASVKEFYWQDGYGAFSMNPLQVENVIKYITEQHDHHQKFSFQEEYRSFLRKYKVDFDDRYIWD